MQISVPKGGATAKFPLKFSTVTKTRLMPGHLRAAPGRCAGPPAPEGPAAALLPPQPAGGAGPALPPKGGAVSGGSGGCPCPCHRPAPPRNTVQLSPAVALSSRGTDPAGRPDGRTAGAGWAGVRSVQTAQSCFFRATPTTPTPFPFLNQALGTSGLDGQNLSEGWCRRDLPVVAGREGEAESCPWLNLPFQRDGEGDL